MQRKVPPTHPPDSTPQPARPRRPFERFLFILLLMVVGLLLLRMAGVKLLNRTEEGGFVETGGARRATNEREFQEFYEDRQRDRARKTTSADDVLSQFSEELAEGQNSSATLSDLPSSEANFLREIGSKYRKRADDATQIYRLLKTSYKTYSKLKMVMNEVVGETEKPMPVSTIAEDEQLAGDFFDKLQKMFNVSKRDAMQFSKEGHKTDADWVEFVENQKEE